MIVVVSAIVDPWVTTLSFVVALAMRIQDSKALFQSISMIFRSIPTQLLQLSSWFHLILSCTISSASCYLVRINPESAVDSNGKE